MKDTGMHIVIGCSHVPWHNTAMMHGVLELMKDLGSRLKGFHIAGDFMDMNSLSGHDKGKVPLTGVTLDKEYKAGNKVLDDIDTAIGKRDIHKTFQYGNHEDRYLRELKNVDSSKFGRALLSPEDGLHLEDRGFIVNAKWQDSYVTLGNHLQIFHGEFLGVNPSKTQLNKLKSSCVFFHTHRFGSHFEGKQAAFNLGFGGDIKAPVFDYAGRLTKMNWINGFGIITIDDKGFFHVTPISVYDDRFYYNGKRYGK
jgi:hypothetical protein